MKKRILALALCLALMLGMAAPVYAEGPPPAPSGVEMTVEPDTPVSGAEPSEEPGKETGEKPAEPSEEPGEPIPAPGEEPAETAPPAPTEEPVDPTPAPECDCGAVDGTHVETCPLYIAPMESPAPAIDAEALRASLLSLESEEAIYAFVEGLSAEEYEVLVLILTEDDILVLAVRCGISLEEVVVMPPKNYTEVGPLSPSVTVAGGRARSMLRAVDDEPENGLILNKRAVYDKTTNLARITIEAYTTGTVTSSEQSVPADIVLVLDESGSMANDMYLYTKTYSPSSSTTCYVKNGDSYTQMFWCSGLLTHSGGWFTVSHFPFSHGGTQYIPMTSAVDATPNRVQFYTRTSVSKQATLKAAASEFVEAVYDDATANNVDHRVSVIGFSSDNSSTIKIGLSGDIRNNKGISGNPAAGTVLYAINQLGANGGTYIEDGMTNAKTAFDNAATTSATTRNRVVIVFTDGIPGNGTWSDTTISNSANPAIATSSQLKNAYGATVYTIGMLDDADPELAISNETTNAARTNKFLHYLSSNYPNATSMSSGGVERENKGYYLSAGDTESLSTIFEKISDEIATPAIDLGADTAIQDVVSPYFDMPAGTGAVTVETYDCLSFDGATGSAAWSTSGVMLNDAVAFDGSIITVTGFDFTKNFVSQMPKPDTTADRGKKIVITFDVTPRDGFWGGDGVPTNGDASGVYTGDGAQVESFQVPEVNVPLNVPDFAGNTVNVYYGGDSPESSALYTPLTMPTGSDAWKDDFVTLGLYTVTHGPVSTTQDGATYTVSMTASSGLLTQMKTATATVQVFLPQFTVTARDLWADYGVAVPLAQWGLVQGSSAPEMAVTWMRESIASTATGITMANSQPAISNYTFTFAAAGTSDGSLSNNIYTTGELDADFDVGLATCTVGSTEYPVPGGALTVGKAAEGENHDFTVHINKFKMTIRKTFDGDSTYKQDCIFTVSMGGTSFNVVIPADSGTKTVVGLVCGKEYTVTKESSWSWRYTASRPGPVTCASNAISNTPPAEAFFNAGNVSITNMLKNDRWLSDKDMKSNLFAAKERRRAAKGEG